MRIGVLGAGSWGTTLGLLLEGRGHTVTLWEYRRELAEEVMRERENRLFLPGVKLPSGVTEVWEIAKAVEGAELLLFVVPSQVTRGVAAEVRPLIKGDPIVVTGSKGLEKGTLSRMSVVLAEELGEAGEETVALVGPSIAREVARGVPTAVVAASRSPERARRVQAIFATDRFRVYTNDDLVGVELAVALKNIIAIAAGICDGLGYGTNTKAALVTRGLAEISRLGVKLGANPLTFSGLAGLGDLVTTCMSPHSRNRTLGEMVGRGKSLAEALDEMVMVAEGVETARVALTLAEREEVELPIAAQVAEVLYNGKDPERAMGELMSRDQKGELAGVVS